MVEMAETVEWTTVRNEVEALMLEWSLIKEHRPRFNIRLRDDKSYPFLAVTVDEPWPRAMVMRGRKRKGVRYFGPYGHAYAIRDTLDELLRSFPIRTCSPAKFRQHERLGRPCLLYHIEKCTGPCVGEIEEDAVPPARQRAVRLPRRRHRHDRAPPRRRDAAGSRVAGVREGGPGARPPGRRPPGDRAPADRRRPPRGPRRHRHRRRRVGGVGAGVLRPQGASRRTQGVHARQGRGPHARAGWSTGSSSRCTARTRPRVSPSRCSCRSSRTIWRRTRNGWRCCGARG